MHKALRTFPLLVLSLLAAQAALAQQPIHWDATLDSAKANARQSNRLVLAFFCADWCGPCHRLENDLRAQAGAAANMEENFVPVKVNYDYYQNTAKQYGVTKFPTTVIIAPTAQGEALGTIVGVLPVDQYLAEINRIAADVKRRNAGAFAQIQASPAVGAPVGMPANAAPAAPQARPAAAPASNPPAARPDMLAMATAAAQANIRPLEPQAPAANSQPSATAPIGLEGFCPVQLVEHSRWQPGNKSWGVIHRGRTYLFSGPEEQRRFLADPDRYAPVRSGDDIVLIVDQGRSASGLREHGVQFDGHVYLFTSEGTLEKFHSNPRYYAERALQAVRPGTQTAAVR